MRHPDGNTSLIAFGTTEPASASGPESELVIRSPRRRPMPPTPTTDRNALRPSFHSPMHAVSAARRREARSSGTCLAYRKETGRGGMCRLATLEHMATASPPRVLIVDDEPVVRDVLT